LIDKSDGTKKKVGYILRKFPVLSETFVLNEILELEAQGVEVHIFSAERPNDPRFHKNLHLLKAHVTYLPDLLKMKSLWRHRKKAAANFPKGFRQALGYVLKHPKPSLLFRLLQSCYVCNTARKERITHFHAHFATRATTLAFLCSMISGIPYSFTAHAVDIFKDSLCKKALSRKIDFANFIVTVSEYNKNYLSTHFGHSAEKILKIYNGIDLKVFHPKIKKEGDPFTFVCVARFVEKKGHKVLVDACEILKDQGINFRCWMVGKGKLETDIRNAITRKKLQGFIEILGPHTHDEVLERFHQSHVYVLPCVEGKNGNKDGLPVALVEALACGLPVITTPMTGNPEVVKHGMNGFLVPFEDPYKTAEAMRIMLEDTVCYQALSGRARSSIEDYFDSKKTVKALISKFKECQV
jgi:colanic acid/amylovoran biosynthesis glycosyltransferase